MSWFDTSFSFAKSALNQAQKSIDKVLDIKEGPDGSETTSKSGSLDASTSQNPKNDQTSSSPSSLSQAESKSAVSTVKPISHLNTSQSYESDSSKTDTSEVFSSTWGLSESTWASPFTGTKSTPVNTSSAPPTSPSVKEGSKVTPASKGTRTRNDRRNKVRSAPSQSPPVTSTPVSEGSGLSFLDKDARDREGETITPVKPLVQNTSSKLASASERVKEAKHLPEKISSNNNQVMEDCNESIDTATITPSETATVIPVTIACDDTHPDEDTLSPSKQNVDSTDGVMSSSAVANPQTIAHGSSPVGKALEYVTQVSVSSDTNSDTSTGQVKDCSEGTSVEFRSPESANGRLYADSEVNTGTGLTKHATSQKESSQCSPRHQRESTDLQKTPTPSNINNNESSARQVPIGCVDGNDDLVDVPQTSQSGEDIVSNDFTSPTRSIQCEVTETARKDIPPSLSPAKETSTKPNVIAEDNDLESGSSKDTIDSLKKETTRLGEILEARESKMIEMSRQIVSLTEENLTLQRELAEVKESGETDVEDMRSEFARRIGASDKKLQAITKERDSLRKQLQAVQNEKSLQRQSEDDSLSKLLKEKEEQVAQLMEEGEKLSKQELQSNSTIKKLRQKERQNDQLLTSQRQHIEDLEGKIKNLKEQCKKREENERKYQESLGQLNTIAEQQAKELTTLKTERDELSDKVRSLQTNLDSAYKELADLQKENAVTQTAVQEAAITAQSTARDELKSLLDQQKVETQREKDALLLQLDELRMSMSRAEQLSARKEDHLRQEVTDTQQRLQEAETRNQEITSTISQATKPLLRQIENLQAAHSTQTSNWERVEASLTQRLVDVQTQLSQSTEKERSAVEKEMTLQSKVNVLESQLGNLRQEKSQLLASVELAKAKLQTLEEGQYRESAKMDGLRASYQQTVDDLRKEKEMLERQLEYEKVRLEAESKKAKLEAQEKERLRSQLVNLSSLSRPPAVRQSSSGSVHSQSELLDHSLHLSESGVNMPDMFDHHGYTHRRSGTSASDIEHLHSLVKQREGELNTSQSLVGTLERSRSVMAEDLSTLSAENEALKNEVEEIPTLKDKLLAVERKHEAMLQMYGEKAEEAEELKLDILDLKAMYRQQIDELLSTKR